MAVQVQVVGRDYAKETRARLRRSAWAETTSPWRCVTVVSHAGPDGEYAEAARQRRRVCRGGEAEVARQRRASCIVRRAYFYAAYRRRASKIKLLCPVPLYQVCKDPHSKQALPQWPNCTSDPQNYGTWACRAEQKKVARVAHRGGACYAKCMPQGQRGE